MRKEKRGHAHSTDDRGRAGASTGSDTIVMRQDGGAGGKGKGMGGSAEKEEETARCRDGGKSGGRLRSSSGGKGLKNF
jgi:hypothetical protein